MKRFRQVSTAFASGWMAVRGIRRRRGYHRGFVLSDHADWRGLLETVEQSRASRLLVTHGSSDTLARYLREVKGMKADALTTQFGEEDG
jgi:putative mRNA 3-end processing factor